MPGCTRSAPSCGRRRENKTPCGVRILETLCINDAGTSTITLYHNGGAVCDRVLKDGAFGPMTFDEVSGICLGAFPSQVGLGSGAGWTAEASFYTGAMDEIYLYDQVLTPAQVTALYEQAK